MVAQTANYLAVTETPTDGMAVRHAGVWHAWRNRSRIEGDRPQAVEPDRSASGRAGVAAAGRNQPHAAMAPRHI